MIAILNLGKLGQIQNKLILKQKIFATFSIDWPFSSFSWLEWCNFVVVVSVSVTLVNWVENKEGLMPILFI